LRGKLEEADLELYSLLLRALDVVRECAASTSISEFRLS
jgi:hypothetical protein